MDDNHPLQRLRRFDAERESLPGEHLFAIATGTLLLTRRSHSTLGWLVSRGLGMAFVLRGLTGRDGPMAQWRQRRSTASAERSPGADAGLQRVGEGWPAQAQQQLATKTEKIDEGWH